VIIRIALSPTIWCRQPRDGGVGFTNYLLYDLAFHVKCNEIEIRAKHFTLGSTVTCSGLIPRLHWPGPFSFTGDPRRFASELLYFHHRITHKPRSLPPAHHPPGSGCPNGHSERPQPTVSPKPSPTPLPCHRISGTFAIFHRVLPRSAASTARNQL
jgi:hypothetical protein